MSVVAEAELTIDRQLSNARRLYRRRDYEASRELLNRVLVRDPGNPKALQGLRILEKVAPAPRLEPLTQPTPDPTAPIAETEEDGLDSLVSDFQVWRQARGIRAPIADGSSGLSRLSPEPKAPDGVRYITSVNMLGAAIGFTLALVALFTGGPVNVGNGVSFYLLLTAAFIMTLFYGPIFLGLGMFMSQTAGPLPAAPSIPVNNLAGALLVLGMFALQFFLFQQLRRGHKGAYLGILIPSALAWLLAVPTVFKGAQAYYQMTSMGLPLWPLLVLALWFGQVTFSVAYLGLSRNARNSVNL